MRLEVHAREPFADGHRFAGTGAYEVVTATAHYAVDPEAPAHHCVPDLALAPRDDTGLVRFSGDVEILRPVDGGRRRLFFDWGNRGNKRAVQYFCDAPHTNRPRTPADAGNGYLLRRGYTVVFGAWQGDLLPGDGPATTSTSTTDSSRAGSTNSPARPRIRSSWDWAWWRSGTS
ncbi:hypothetical protein ABT404_43005 [Streptomyces hyaluromycini]|uniref:Uncharacterized protein n=1 Tax=Streptomyces hyaluromycini TaxID=1377993 RepID=A0ABV1XAU8_9ACTN